MLSGHAYHPSVAFGIAYVTSGTVIVASGDDHDELAATGLGGRPGCRDRVRAGRCDRRATVPTSAASSSVGHRAMISRPPLRSSRSTAGMIGAGSTTNRCSGHGTTGVTAPFFVLQPRWASRSRTSAPRLAFDFALALVVTASTLGPRGSFTDMSGSTGSSHSQHRQPSASRDLVEVAHGCRGRSGASLASAEPYRLDWRHRPRARRLSPRPRRTDADFDPERLAVCAYWRCGELFERRTANQRFCRKACRSRQAKWERAQAEAGRRTAVTGDELASELLETTAFLRRIATSKDLLSGLTTEERTELLNAAGDVFCADPEERRLRVKAQRNRRRAEKLRRDEEVLASTGIRRLREKPVFTTPNVFAPDEFEQRRRRRPRVPRDHRPPALLHLQGEVPRGPPLLRPALSAVRGVQPSPSGPSWPISRARSACSPVAG